VIQTSERELGAMGRYEMSDREWEYDQTASCQQAACLPRVDDRRILNGIFLRRYVRTRLGRISPSATDRAP